MNLRDIEQIYHSWILLMQILFKITPEPHNLKKKVSTTAKSTYWHNWYMLGACCVKILGR